MEGPVSPQPRTGGGGLGAAVGHLVLYALAPFVWLAMLLAVLLGGCVGLMYIIELRDRSGEPDQEFQ